MSKIILEFDLNEVDADGHFLGTSNEDDFRVAFQGRDMYFVLDALSRFLRETSEADEGQKFRFNDGFDWKELELNSDHRDALELASYKLRDLMDDYSVRLDILE